MTAGKRFGGVVLVGFMGSGKSSVGRALARMLDAEFVDLDAWIEKAAGRSIPALFAEEGEPAFREREKAALREVLAVKGRIVATGGGAFLDEGNRQLLKSYAPVVHLEAGVRTILGRVSRETHRPLLGEGDREKTVSDLLSRRLEGYRQADFAVPTDGRTVAEVAARIVELLRMREGERS
ncbi:MAG: shikimate kinase [Verrucomicrobiota bacterium]